MLPLSLLQTAVNKELLVELRNGDTYNGKLTGCNAFMNICLTDVICTSSDGSKFWKMTECYIHGNSIKYLRVPDEIIDEVPTEEESRENKFSRPNSGGGGRGEGGRGGRGEGRGGGGRFEGGGRGGGGRFNNNDGGRGRGRGEGGRGEGGRGTYQGGGGRGRGEGGRGHYSGGNHSQTQHSNSNSIAPQKALDQKEFPSLSK